MFLIDLNLMNSTRHQTISNFISSTFDQFKIRSVSCRRVFGLCCSNLFSFFFFSVCLAQQWFLFGSSNERKTKELRKKVLTRKFFPTSFPFSHSFAVLISLLSPCLFALSSSSFSDDVYDQMLGSYQPSSFGFL